MQVLVQDGGVGQVMGTARGGHGPQQVAVVQVKLDEQVGGGKAAAGSLARRVAKLLTQLRRVGHGEAGAVRGEQAVAVPEGVQAALGRGAAGAEDGLVQAAAEAAGQALAGLAGGGVGEVKAGEVAEFADGGVTVQDLAEEEVGGHDGGQGALAEADADVAGKA